MKRAAKSNRRQRSGTASRSRRAAKPATAGSRQLATRAAAALDDARQAGLLDGEKTARVSFRAPPALVEAAMKESGAASPTELGILALAMLAQSDPFVAFMKRTSGRLGKDHKLEYWS